MEDHRNGEQARRSVNLGRLCRNEKLAGDPSISLASTLVVDIARVLCDDAIAEKIRTKHAPLTVADVRQALILARDVRTRWVEDEVHGCRLAARAQTLKGTEFIAYLSPLNEDDPEEGTFKLRTAIPRPT